ILERHFGLTQDSCLLQPSLDPAPFTARCEARWPGSLVTPFRLFRIRHLLKLLSFRFEIQYSAATAITAIAANCRHRHPVNHIPESIQTQTSLKTANNNPDRTTQFETTVRTVSRKFEP